MEKRINPLEDPRRLWKLQLAVALLTMAWIFAVNAVGEPAAQADGNREQATPPSVTVYAVEALPEPDSPVPLPPVAAQGIPSGKPARLPITPPVIQADEPDSDSVRQRPVGGDAAVAPSEVPSEETQTVPEPTYYDVPLSRELQDYIRALCEEYAVPMPLVLAIIERESDFRPDCVSRTHDYGLMQVNRCNFESCRAKFGDVDLLDPRDNLRCGVWLFANEYHAEDGDAVRALMRYNNGPTGARRKWAQGITETAYTRKVMAAWERYGKAAER